MAISRETLPQWINDAWPVIEEANRRLDELDRYADAKLEGTLGRWSIERIKLASTPEYAEKDLEISDLLAPILLESRRQPIAEARILADCINDGRQRGALKHNIYCRSGRFGRPHAIDASHPDDRERIAASWPAY